MKPLTVYTAASFRLLHAVRLFHDALRARVPDVQILDWTEKATTPNGLTPDERRRWFDSDQPGGQVFEFCADACRHADIVVYLGASGQDAGVEAGIAAGAGTPVLGVAGPLEAPGLMLHGAVNLWSRDVTDALDILQCLALCCKGSCSETRAQCSTCKARPVCNVPAAGATWR